RLGFSRLLALAMAEAVVPYLRAMRSRVSPAATVWLVVLEPPPPSPGRLDGTKLFPDSDRREPTKMRFGSVMPLASASWETDRPYLAAIDPSVSPALTMWKEVDEPPLPLPPEGIVSFCPIRMRLGFLRLFALAMAATGTTGTRDVDLLT